jgi:hypothetical protein
MKVNWECWLWEKRYIRWKFGTHRVWNNH